MKSDTLFALEYLTDVSFDDNLRNRSRQPRNELRTWSFHEPEQFLTYKAEAVGSRILKVPLEYTSQRCPKCVRIRM